MKYHINKDGVASVCKARFRACPLGGNEVHFSSLEEAQSEAQIRMKTQFGISPKEEESPELIHLNNDVIEAHNNIVLSKREFAKKGSSINSIIRKIEEITLAPKPSVVGRARDVLAYRGLNDFEEIDSWEDKRLSGALDDHVDSERLIGTTSIVAHKVRRELIRSHRQELEQLELAKFVAEARVKQYNETGVYMPASKESQDYEDVNYVQVDPDLTLRSSSDKNEYNDFVGLHLNSYRALHRDFKDKKDIVERSRELKNHFSTLNFTGNDYNKTEIANIEKTIRKLDVQARNMVTGASINRDYHKSQFESALQDLSKMLK